MKKLRLEVEALQVESFEAAGPREPRGTVFGAESFPTSPLECVTFTCGDSQVRPCLQD